MALDKKNDISNLFCKVFIANFDRRKCLRRLPELCKITGSPSRKLEVKVFPHCNDVQ